MSNNIKRITELEGLINYHDYMYHDQDKPVISDSQYDNLVYEYHDLMEQTPGYVSRIKVGFVDPDPSMRSIPIVEPMLSIGKRKSKEDFQKWISTNVSTDVSYEDKLDGIALRLIYLNGELTSIHLRGTVMGADVSHRRHLLRNIPDVLTEYKDTEKVEFTGEAFCKFIDFDRYVEKYSLNPKETDTRSTVSGLMKRHKKTDRDDLPIYFKVYSASKNIRDKFETYPQLRDHFTDIGFDIPIQMDLGMVDDLLNLPSKPKNEYPIDGIVAKDNDLRKWEKPQKGEYYSYGICYKFPTICLETKVTGIDWSLTLDGSFVGTLLYSPVEYDGTQLTRAKLDYAGSYFKKGLGIGAVIQVTKGNEIIPRIVSLVSPATGTKFSFPERCPFCDKLVQLEDNDNVARCINDACEGQLIKQLIRLVDKNGLNIKGLGDVRIKALVDNGFISKHADLFNLKEDDLINAGVDAKTTEDIIEQINKVNDLDILHWLYALGIPNLGITRAAEVSNMAASNGLNDGLKFYNLKDLMTILTDSKYLNDLFGLDGLVIGSHIKKHQDEIESFLVHYDFSRERAVKLMGIPVAITGSWVALTRKLMEEGLEEAGYLLADSVTKSAKVLLVGNKPSPAKIEKAKRFGIPIIDITQVHELSNIVTLIMNIRH